MKKFLLEVITPERPLIKKNVDFLVVPAYEGELGVLANHIDLLAELVPGEVRIYNDGVIEYLAISGGFIEVKNNEVKVLAETAEMAEEIDSERARLALERAKKQIKKEMNILEAEAALKRALVRLKIAEKLRRARKH